ncbi:MAG TPA: hypothetical protein VGL34_14795, partial [Steroidobacteraceae bacterium]
MPVCQLSQADQRFPYYGYSYPYSVGYGYAYPGYGYSYSYAPTNGYYRGYWPRYRYGVGYA